jgi:hypothetical protein
VESETQILSYYDRVLQAIHQAGGMGRMHDLMVLCKKEANYWRMDQLNMTLEELSMAFHNFVSQKEDL